jgi:predicted oxidoreductase (fatty acid repression mutant protein)
MKCCNSAFNAQGSRVIIVVLQAGAVIGNSSASAEEKGNTA